MQFRDTEKGKAWNREYQKRWTSTHPNYWRRWAWKSNGLDPDKAQEAYDSTDRCCVCDSFVTGSKKHVDHEHGSSLPRGILCNECNTAIGQMHEDVKIMEKAIEYLTALGLKINESSS
jgi:hypothetical protein